MIGWVNLERQQCAYSGVRKLGRFPKSTKKLARVELLFLYDWGTHRLTYQQHLDLLEFFEERYQRRSAIIAAQLPVSGWHQMIGAPTIEDAILDRIIHDAYPIIPFAAIHTLIAAIRARPQASY